MSNKLYTDLGIEFSQTAAPAGVKIMLWGNTATRKTEFVVRHFPHVLILDIEGNTDMIVNHPDVPAFLRVKTKDVRQVLKAIEAAASGELKFPDGSPVETVSIDSWSVLWGVQSDVASMFAEKRASKYANASVDEANITMTDWSKSKRPMKRILNAINGSKIKYLFFIARSKDEYETQGAEAKKTGRVIPDVMKGTEYDMNLSLNFSVDGGKWSFTPTKVQGELGSLFPLGKKMGEFPFEKFFALFGERDTSKSIKPKDDDEIASEIVDEENYKGTPKTQAGLIEYAKSKGISAIDLGAILKNNGFQGFDASKWDDMVKAVDKATP
jgi:hypothetical protein